MPTILPPDEHLTAGLSAVQKHIDHHEGELLALRALRSQYKDALGLVGANSVHVEQTPAEPIRLFSPAEPIRVFSPAEQSFDDLVSTMSGRIPQQ